MPPAAHGRRAPRSSERLERAEAAVFDRTDRTSALRS
jgi:hypothetical protein